MTNHGETSRLVLDSFYKLGKKKIYKVDMEESKL